MIKVSCNTNYILYVDIFNLILKSGKYPSTWRENFIKPLFKGDSTNDPSCYRGIAISSCLSKLFTRILFNRLEKYLENNNIICPEQIGFNETSIYMSSIIFKKCPLILYLFSLNKSDCLLTVSKAFFKSTKQTKRYLLFLKNLSIRDLSENI
jgi:hypothetical protein